MVRFEKIYKAASKTIRNSTKIGIVRLFVLVFFTVISIGCSAIYDSGFVPIPGQPVSGPIEIGSEWVEVIPPKPLIPYGLQQSIVIGYQDYDKNKYSDDFVWNVLNLADGRKTRIEAFLFDDKGESYELQISGIGGVRGGVWFSRRYAEKMVDGKKEYEYQYFPKDRTYTKLRIRSEIPLKCEFIEWRGSTPK